MKLRFIFKNKHAKDILVTLLAGSLSLLLGLVKFYVPGLEVTGTDLREIPLLIGIYHLSNPLYSIGISAISIISIPSGIPFLPTFTSHTIALIIYWFVFSFLKKQKRNIVYIQGFWFLSVLIYFLVLAAPLVFIVNKIYGFPIEGGFISFYKQFIFAVRFELFSTSIIVSLYILQDQIRKELKKHKAGLETLVKNRTEELETANEELQSMNTEMYEKSNIIYNKNEELNTTLKQLKETQANLIQIEKMASLGVLTAGVAHEINNPLNYIMGGYVGLKHYFEDHSCPDTKNIETLLNAIQTGVDRASGIVRGLNQFSRDNEMNDEKCNLNSILDNCLLMIHNQIKQNIEIEKEYEDDLPEITGNVGKLHQVLMNVLTNANQAVKDNGKIYLRTKKLNEFVCVEIIDTGEGIEKGDLPKVTDPFFTTKEPGKGTGLGLTISNSIIKDHGGALELISEPGKGTTVRILLPI